MYKITTLAIFLSLLFACKSTQQINDSNPSTLAPKNIILLIGDGMGVPQIAAGTYMNNNTSNLERFSHTGLHKSYCSDSLITDSAAGATAFASGVKTYYGAVGVDADTIPVETLLEIAASKKMSTGLIATCRINHATPASFIAHNKSRQNYEEIALDFLETPVDYMVGGGLKYFNRREDERDLTEELKLKGYLVGDHLEEFNIFSKKIPTAEKVAYFTADNDPLPVAQGRDYFERAAMLGLDFLSQKSDKGFFIMIESSQIDWGGHSNNQDYIISEFLEFNRVIGKILDWAQADGETLVVLTADHETGGFTIQPGSHMNDIKTTFTTKKHTADFIPVFAFGPGAHLFTGLYENIAVNHKIKEAMGWSKN